MVIIISIGWVKRGGAIILEAIPRATLLLDLQCRTGREADLTARIMMNMRRPAGRLNYLPLGVWPGSDVGWWCTASLECVVVSAVLLLYQTCCRPGTVKGVAYRASPGTVNPWGPAPRPASTVNPRLLLLDIYTPRPVRLSCRAVAIMT